MAGGKEVSNKQVLLKRYVVGWPTEADMELVTTTQKLELQGSKEVLVKVLYVSCDPYMRGRMTDSTDSYSPPFQPGKPLSGYGIGKVILSSDPEFVENEYVFGFLNWEEYSTGLRLLKVDPSVASLSYWLGILGMSCQHTLGCSAEEGRDRVCLCSFRSSGAVGQFAKLSGCYVVGSAAWSKQQCSKDGGQYAKEVTQFYHNGAINSKGRFGVAKIQ